MKKIEWKDRLGQLCILAIYLIPYLVYIFTDGAFGYHSILEFSPRELVLLFGAIIAFASGVACFFLGRRKVNNYHWTCSALHLFIISAIALTLIYYY